jgi:hypothetical protein
MRHNLKDTNPNSMKLLTFFGSEYKQLIRKYQLIHFKM